MAKTKTSYFKSWADGVYEAIQKDDVKMSESVPKKDDSVNERISKLYSHPAQEFRRMRTQKVVELNDNTVIYIRRNKLRMSLGQLAEKWRTTKADVAYAAYGQTFQHLNAAYPPWPTPAELEKNPNAWEQRRVDKVEKFHPWRKLGYKRMKNG